MTGWTKTGATLVVACAAAACAARAQPVPMVTPPMPPMMATGVLVHGVFDQFEGRVGGAGLASRWAGQVWAGGDYNKIWLKSEGVAAGRGGIEDGRHELLYGRAISAYADLLVGARADWDTGTGRGWAALGLQGLAPLFFNYEAMAYLSDRGHAAARVAVSYDLLLTQDLILQPAVEVNFYSKSDPGRGVGTGLADIDTGLRLRYEISRKFAPYIGVAYAGKFGQTARLAGTGASSVQFVFGIRSWF